MRTDEKIVWSDSFSVGNKKLDEQHFKIVSFINELIDMPAITRQAEALDCINKMLSYSVEHLDYEERLLRENNYPESSCHSVIHKFYVKKVQNFLKEWWTYHILEEDMKYRSFLKEKGLL
jgi:hemerythrin